ncbi:MAG TPA: FkbM family methyltransferase, partial [Nitrospiria bacterium]|nr:FkbM family methyltransferase [Nitrospiria bacterium]
ELEVLEGMSEILNGRRKPILYVEVHPVGFGGRGDPEKVCSLLEKHYQNIQVRSPLGALRSALSPWNRLSASMMPRKYLFEKCKASLGDVKSNPQRRYQLLCLP